MLKYPDDQGSDRGMHATKSLKLAELIFMETGKGTNIASQGTVIKYWKQKGLDLDKLFLTESSVVNTTTEARIVIF